ncbi:MAG: hypothetical protein ACXIUB_10635 [Wenzhouxiangella sp.]
MNRLSIPLSRCSLILLCLFLVVACGTSSSARERQEAMDRWERLVRWDQFDNLVDFMHPDYLAENPVTNLDIDRLNQFRVTEYRVRQVLVSPDSNEVQRLARIRLYHVHSGRERVVDYREVWRLDEDLGVWLLHSGLPDPRRNPDGR